MNTNQNQNQNEMKNLQKKVTKNLIKDYSNLLNGNSFTDFSIFVENKSNPFEFKVHKSILCSRSPFFDKFLREKNEIGKIFLNQFNKKEMESILSYIYYGNISFENQENLIQLMEISIYFKLNLLKEIIQKKISNSINYSNFFQFFFQNRDLKLNEIEMKCFELINQNFSQIQNNENLFNLTKEEIIKFIQFKQEKKEIFQFDFFQFLNNWIEKRNQRLKGKKEKQKKRLSHSFFSLFDKDSISKQEFDKLKKLDFFLPKSFLIDIQQPLLEIKGKEVEEKEKEKEKLNLEIEKMKPIFEKYSQIENEIKKNFPPFSDSEIIKEMGFMKKLKEWIKDDDFFSKMKKGYSAKKDGFDCKTWHSFCDDKGKTLVIIQTKENYIFGGFTSIGFTSNESKWSIKRTNPIRGYISDPKAFIFSLRNDKNDRSSEKFRIRKERNSIYYFIGYGPSFAGVDKNFDFYLKCHLKGGYSNFGYSYSLPKGIKKGTNEAQSYLAGSFDKWVVDELETYFI
ncbi:pep-cterm sorting domain-containing protein [Anaeramoeba ignava]|uniref:Pep-cterm sorting domain-containing protein n=1 Tax=Anaeramoeba ignava TaxID=1746090 RepID=A0A9Q0R7Y8_ANAIG|nr:pep-cterm sorting domain-containing protein [Anaeramoeba ignava]